MRGSTVGPKVYGIPSENISSEVEVDFSIITLDKVQGNALRISTWLLVEWMIILDVAQ